MLLIPKFIRMYRVWRALDLTRRRAFHLALGRRGNSGVGRSPRNYHARADADAAVEVHNVFVIHADAAMRHESTDRARRIGTMDGVFTAGQRHGRRSHRVMRGAAWNDARHSRAGSMLVPTTPARC